LWMLHGVLVRYNGGWRGTGGVPWGVPFGVVWFVKRVGKEEW
jgi:hypothetical protein